MSESNSDLFLLGAGFSKAVSNEMPLMENLSGELVSSLKNSELFQNDFDWSLLEENFELGLTLLSQENPWLTEVENTLNRARFLELSKAIGKIIQGRSDEAFSSDVAKKQAKEWLLPLVKKWHENQSAVFTLNYDTIIERVASGLNKNGVEVKGEEDFLFCSDLYPIVLTHIVARSGDGILGSTPIKTFKLYKLHGSINWFYAGRLGNWNETIYYASFRGGLDKAEDQKEKEYELAHISGKVPFIIPPTLGKSVYFNHENFSFLWRQAAKRLRKTKRVFCLGYSFPEMDLAMRFLLTTNLNKDENIPFYVINTDAKLPERLKKMFEKDTKRPKRPEEMVKNICSVDASFCREGNPIKDFCSAYVNGEF